MRWTIIAAFALSACGFTPSRSPDNSNDAGVPPGTDARDGCPWGPRALFDPCGANSGDIVAPARGTTTIDTVGFDTTMGTFSSPLPPFDHKLVTIDGVDTYVWVVHDLHVTGTLTVTGDHALLVAAFGAITIDAGAVIDASSRTDIGALDFEYGPGAFAGLGCGSEPGDSDLDGGGGGAGGSFGSSGGAGGEGRAPLELVPGGAPNSTVAVQDIGAHRSGCFGGNGGEGDTTTAAVGAPGGGGLILSAIETIRIAGLVNSNGAGGIGQIDGRRGGGSGAGSGGLIVIESARIEPTGGLYAKGGGGGGGATNFTMLSDAPELTGEDGAPGMPPAPGAVGEPTNPQPSGGDGASATIPAQSGLDGERGGGGGGGGLGHIVFVVSDPSEVVGSPSDAAPTPAITDVAFRPFN